MGSPQFNPAIGTETGTPPSPEARIRDLIAKALKRCSKLKDRQQVTLELNTLTHLGITKSMLDDWTSPSKKGLRFPASLVKALCEVTGDDALALAIIPTHLREQIAVGSWAMRSQWVLDRVRVQIGKQTRRELRKHKAPKRMLAKVRK